MYDTLKGAFSRVLWSICLTGIVMVVTTVAMVTQYRGEANLNILGYGLAVAVGFAVVVIFVRWSLAVMAVGGAVGVLVYHLSFGVVISAVVGFALAFAAFLYWELSDRHLRH